MKRWLIIACVSLSACTTSTGPVVIRDAGDLPKLPVSTTNSNGQPASDRVVVAQPVAPAVKSQASDSPLKKQLLNQSAEALRNKQPKTAIALSEKGLRIDRKEPRFYYFLAKSYRELSDQQQSIYFAKQGLRYATKGSDTYTALQQLAR